MRSGTVILLIASAVRDIASKPVDKKAQRRLFQCERTRLGSTRSWVSFQPRLQPRWYRVVMPCFRRQPYAYLAHTKMNLLPPGKPESQGLWLHSPAGENVGTAFGEITREGLSVFSSYYRSSETNRFLDLGSGNGKSLLYFYELFPQTAAITGIEYIQKRHDDAVATIRASFPDAPEPSSNSEYHYGVFHLYRGDFFDRRFKKIIDEEAVVISSIQISSCGSTPTLLDQSWGHEQPGHIWKVGVSRRL
eukprot:gnl/TRDRNA2_/TRDRNA2_170068_c6_seq3.p1 gnl/TRDRNA2_/TRDRNA2_170068_c6~~gnl/TRDRNA2_/TRDRNA2_170068_c6_seq3.p1  ORF type:complete len:248 (-),score=4.92 gnl/TRDRNA2_/TRDRNA2_170068_c6_seq3:34-777(-)